MKKILLSSLLLASGFVIACTGDSASQPPVDASTSDVAQSTDSGNADTSIDDAAVDDGGLVELDGGTIDDGGGTIDPDGGVPEVDAGVDAGACGPPSGNGPTFQSSCSSFLTIYNGGTIVAGTYNLVSFTVVGNALFCGSYTPAGYSGKLVVTKTLTGYRFDERVAASNIVLQKPNRSFAVAQTTTSPMSVTQLCGSTVNSKSWGFSSGKVATDAGTKIGLNYVHDFGGTASVRLRWVQQ